MKRPKLVLLVLFSATILPWLNLNRNLRKFILANESTEFEFDPEPNITDALVKILTILFFINRNKNGIFIIFGIFNLIRFCFYQFYPVKKIQKNIYNF